MKAPHWVPFPFSEKDLDVFIPNRLGFINYFTDIESKGIKFLDSLEKIFWYLLSKSILELPYTQRDNELYDEIMHYRVEMDNTLGFFSINPLNLDQKARKKLKGQSPDVYSTFYALASLKYLGKLNHFLNSSTAAPIKNFIIKFLVKISKNNIFKHCLNSKCKVCKDNLQKKVLFFILMIYDLLGIHPSNKNREFLLALKIREKPKNNIFRLLCLQYISSKKFVSDEDIIKIYKNKKPNGGYNLQNSANADVNDTFWIGYTLSTYQWLLPYQAGPFYAYAIRDLRRVLEPTKLSDTLSFENICQLIVLLSIVFSNLVNELEELMFSRLSEFNLMDMNILTVKGGVHGAEAEIVNYVNQKYKFTLKIVNNEILFEQFLIKLDSFKRNFAIDLREFASKYTQFDISEYRRIYNKNKSKKHRISDSFLIGLIEDMITEHFFTGTIFKKSKYLFKNIYYFARDSYIEQVIVSDKTISIENIKKEKESLKTILVDIYNMTREMEESSANIMREVESFIIFGDVALAEERMTSNIKKALLDATFFNKNIELFQEDFEYVESKFMLDPLVEKWNRVYSMLQQNFINLRKNLSIRIEELKSEQSQHSMVLQLEELINQKINETANSFDNYQNSFRNQLEAEYSREVVQFLIESLKKIEQQVSKADKDISHSSQKITSTNKTITKLRKKVIKLWVSQLEDFNNLITYYHDGFNLWSEKIALIDRAHKEYIIQIEENGDKINQFLEKNDYNKAIEITDKNFQEIQHKIEQHSQKNRKEIEIIAKKSRKLYPLLHNVQTESILIQNVLERLIHQMREKIQASIKTDLKEYTIDLFKMKVEKNITELRENLIEFERMMNSKLQRDAQFSNNVFHDVLKELSRNIDIKNKEMELFLKENKVTIANFKVEFEGSLKNWTDFKKQFQFDIDRLSEKFEEERLIQLLLQIAANRKTNHVSLVYLSKTLSREESDLLKQITSLITQDRINAEIGGDPVEIEIHNESWRKNERLSTYNNVILRELSIQYEKVNTFYNDNLYNHQYLQNLRQIQSLSTAFTQNLFKILENYEIFVQNLNIDHDNVLFQKNHAEFTIKIEDYKQNIESIKYFCQMTEKYKEFLNDQSLLLAKIVQSEINRFYTEIHNRKLIDLNKNLKWVENQKVNLETGMDQIDEKIDQYKLDNSDYFSKSATIMSDIEQDYQVKKLKLQNTLKTAIEDILEKLSFFELNELQQKMEKLIQEKQDHLNQMLKKVDSEIQDKIRIREYMSAALKLNIRNKTLESSLKSIEKEIKTKYKAYSGQSKIFGIKYKYILEQWELYLLDFLNTIQEKEISLRETLILQYIVFLVKALKGSYVPLSKITKDLAMKHDVIQNRIMSLIGDNKLSGKIDLKLDIYFEGSADLDEDIIASLDIMKATNVQTYLLLQRLANIFKIIGPLITAAASLITITWYLTRLSSNTLIILMPVLIVIALVTILWIKKGKDKAVVLKSKPSYS
jgi:hypothetical protein